MPKGDNVAAPAEPPEIRTDAANVPVPPPRLGDPALAASSTAVRAYVDRMRRAYPDASASDLRYMLTQRYLFTVGATGGAAGMAVASRALTTPGAVALTVGQAGSFLGASAVFALAVADVHGVSMDDVDRRRALVLGSLLGEDSSDFFSEALGVTSPTWGRTLLLRLPVTTVKRVNKRLYHRVLRFSLTRVGAIAAGRLLPYGVGAADGYTGGRALGRIVVDGVSEAFGTGD